VVWQWSERGGVGGPWGGADGNVPRGRNAAACSAQGGADEVRGGAPATPAGPPLSEHGELLHRALWLRLNGFDAVRFCVYWESRKLHEVVVRRLQQYDLYVIQMLRLTTQTIVSATIVSQQRLLAPVTAGSVCLSTNSVQRTTAFGGFIRRWLLPGHPST
jgi:hypothetical protein